jgi:hypothetical protein
MRFPIFLKNALRVQKSGKRDAKESEQESRSSDQQDNVGLLWMCWRGNCRIELCRPGGEDAGIQGRSGHSHKLYGTIAAEYPDRHVMLCNRPCVLARSDR